MFCSIPTCISHLIQSKMSRRRLDVLFLFLTLFALSPAMFSQRRVFSLLSAFVSSSCGAFSLKTLITAVGLYEVPVSVFAAKVLGHCFISLLVLLPMI